MAQNKFLSFLNSLDKGASDRNSITEFLANILTPGDNMEYVDGQLLGSGGKPVENIGKETYYGTLGQANFAGNDPVKDGLLSKMTSAPPKLRPLGLLNKGQPEVVNDMMPGERQIQYQRDPISDMMPGERQIQYQPDPISDMMPGEGDFSYAVGSGRGNGAMEQQSREAEAKFNDFLQLVDPSVVDNARNNPELMKVLRDAFFKTYPNLLRGMGGYN